MEHKSYKLKVAKPILIILTLSMFVLFVIVTYLQYMEVETRKSTVAPHFQEVLNIDLEYQHKILDSLINRFRENTKYQKLFLNRDRESLYESVKLYYEMLNKNIELTHFYFLDKDGKVILRVHDFDKHSDIIDRYTFKKSQKTKKHFWGLEFGVKKNLTLRSVYPWYVDGELIGYIEIGKEIDKIINRIAKIMNLDIYIAIDKELYDSLSDNSNVDNKNIYNVKEHYVVYNTNDVPDEFKRFGREDWLSDLHIKKDKEYFHTSSMPLFDVANKKLGHFIFLINATLERSVFIIYMLILVISLIVIVFVIFLAGRYMEYIREQEINKMSKQLVNLAITDELTTLHNRKQFNEQVPLMINNAKRLNILISMIMFDVDYFKKYNDTYGHQAGDIALQKIAAVAKKTFKRASDECFRIGGEEFAVIVIHNQNDNILQRVEYLRKSILRENIKHEKNGGVGVLSISIGLVTCRRDCDLTIDSFYKMADKALYKAKANGRNRIEIYDT